MGGYWTIHTTETLYPSGLIVHDSEPFSGMYGSEQYLFEQTEKFKNLIIKYAGGRDVKETCQNFQKSYQARVELKEKQFQKESTYDLTEGNKWVNIVSITPMSIIHE